MFSGIVVSSPNMGKAAGDFNIPPHSNKKMLIISVTVFIDSVVVLS